MTDPSVALCTCPDQATAERLAGLLVAEHLAACVNIVPGLRSVYEWQGRIETDAELLLVIKTDGTRFPALCERLAQEHPHEVPEILRLPIADGLPAYLDWMASWLRNDT